MRWRAYRFTWGRSGKYLFEDVGDALWVAGVWCAGMSQCLCSQRVRAMLIFAQYLASKGYNVIPTTKLQRYVKGIDLRSAVEDNVAFKLSFGLTFALASLASF